MHGSNRAEHGGAPVVFLPGASKKSDEKSVNSTVLRALGRKALSEAEVRQLVLSNGISENECEEFLQNYREQRYLDDNELATTLAETLQRRKRYGYSQIKRELASRQIPAEIIATVLENSDETEELQRAIELATKKSGQLAHLEHRVAERRLFAYLSRKGYSSSTIRAAIAANSAPSHTVQFH